MTAAMRAVLGTAAVSFVAFTARADAQQPGANEPYMGATIGAHLGIDYLFEGFLIGGQALLHLDPWGRVALIPNAQYEIRRGIRDWQANGDIAVTPIGGVFVGGGISYRNSIFEEEVGRTTEQGFSVFVGYRDPPRPGRLSPQVELRWSFVGDIRPRMITVGANYPLVLFR